MITITQEHINTVTKTIKLLHYLPTDMIISNQETVDAIKSLLGELSIAYNTPPEYIYEIDVRRGGIGEEDFTCHMRQATDPTTDEVVAFLHDMDCGYDDEYCKFYITKLN